MSLIIGTKIVSDSIGFHVDFANRKCFAPNILNYSHWTVSSGGVAADATRYGVTLYTPNSGTVAETARVLGTDPFGYTNSVVWRATNTDPNPGNSDGGWDTGNFAIDNSKLYRFSVWTKRNTMTSGGLNLESGSFYLGHYSRDSTLSLTFSITKSNGVPFNNPYFHVTPNPNPSDITSIQVPFLGGLDVWTLVVGHVWPVGTGTGFNLPGTNINGLVSNTNHPDSGVWTRSSGKIGNLYQVGTGYGDCVWYPSAVFANHRAYLFYAADLTSVQSFIYPRVDIVDGLEPTIQELLAGSEPVRDLSPKANTIYPFGRSNFDLNGKGLVFSLSELDIVGGTMSSTFSANSISVWFSPTNTILTSNVAQTLFQFGPIGGPTWLLYLGEVTGGATNEMITLVGSVGSTLTYVSTASVSSFLANTWYNIVVNFNGTKYDIYLNGVLLTTIAGTNGNAPFIQSVNYVAIGGRKVGVDGWGAFFGGKIGSVLVYERSLDEFEIISNYNATKQKYGVI
jgi:hypothetical protein